MPRVTITEIARRAGVSKGAVSFALNGGPGVSEATRQRVLEIARELDWQPHSAARALSGAPTRAVGLVLARKTATLAFEPFYMEFIAGLESVLGPRGYALLLQVVADAEAEVAVQRRWAAERRVDALVVVDVRVHDERLPVLHSLGLPVVVAGDPTLTAGLTSVWTDDAAGCAAVVEHLAALGHRRIGRVAGTSGLGHVQIRDEAFLHAAQRCGVELVIDHTDFSGDEGGRAARAMLHRSARPTALVFDNDLMAVAALGAATAAGYRVPDDVSLVAWDDSELCRVTHPALTAMGHDVTHFGATAANAVFDLLAGSAADGGSVITPSLRQRASTSSAPVD